MQIGEGHVFKYSINVRNVGSLYTMVVLILAKCLGGIPTSPINEPIEVKVYLLIDDLEGHAMVQRVARRPNLKCKAQ